MAMKLSEEVADKWRESHPKVAEQLEEHIEICPHGRPSVRYIKLADLLREFGRS